MIVALLGTKGGTGTTTMAVNVAADLARLSEGSTLIVDLKPAPGDVALFLGLRPRLSVLDFLGRLAWLDEGTARQYVCAHACGLGVLGAGEEWGRPSDRDAEGVDHLFDVYGSAYEFLVADLGSTINQSTVVALQAASQVILVANPDVPCLRNLQRLIDAVKLAGVGAERLRILLNRASEYGVVSVSQIERVLGLAIDWSVSSDYRTVAAAVTSGMPVSGLRSQTLMSGELAAIAHSIAQSASKTRMTEII